MEQVKRKIYPYSLVPGGAENLLQAKRAMTDPANKNNYADFDLGQLKQVTRFKTNLSGYVSYRWGDKIYWTSKKLTLRAGETVFTDESEHHRPAWALPELLFRQAHAADPAERTQRTSLRRAGGNAGSVTVYSFPKFPVFAPEAPALPPGELTPTVPVLVPALVPAVAPAVGKVGGGFWFPLIPIIPPIRPPSSKFSPHVAIDAAPATSAAFTPVAVVPEPRYGWLALAGLFIVGLFFKQLRARRLN